jgi:Transposase DDE domain
MRKASPYLHALVQGMTSDSGSAEPELWCGYEMISCDGSAVSGPGAEGTDARLHTALRLSDLSFKHVEVTGVSGGETLRRFPWSPGELAIGDRGYANPPGIAWVVEHGADVLVRVNRGSLPLFERDGTRIDVLAKLRPLRVNSPSEWKVQVDHFEHGEHRIIEGRLVAVRLPEDKAEEARRRVRREYGNDATEEQLEAASFVALFTTASRGRLPTKRCLQAYELRWQIELQFKRWKSLCDFDRLPNYRDDTILAWLYAKVLLGLLLDRMASSSKEVFPPERFARRDGRRRESRAARATARATALEDHIDPLARNHRRAAPHATA